MARRAWGEGSTFFDNTKKRWTWKGTYLVNGVKKPKTLTAKRQIDLKKKVDRFKLMVDEGYFADDNINLKTWIEMWLDVITKPSVKKKTLDNYTDRLRYVICKFGDRKLKTLTPLELQNFFNELRLTGGKKQQGLAAESVNCCRRYLKSCLDSAIQNGLLKSNPVVGTKPQRKTKSEMVVMDDHEVQHFLEVVKQGDYIYVGAKSPRYIRRDEGTEYYIQCFYNLCNLALASGMRIGELRGLPWSCVNFKKKYVEVKNQIVKTADDDIFDEPKTEKSKRKIAIDDNTLNDLKLYKNYQLAYEAMLGDKFNNEFNLCFTNTWGKPFDVSNFRDRYFRKMLLTAEVKDGFTPHCMRHTHATLLLKHGVNIKVVSERLGHSSVTVTLNIYAHVLESMEETAPSTWAQIMRGVENETKNL